MRAHTVSSWKTFHQFSCSFDLAFSHTDSFPRKEHDTRFCWYSLLSRLLATHCSRYACVSMCFASKCVPFDAEHSYWKAHEHTHSNEAFSNGARKREPPSDGEGESDKSEMEEKQEKTENIFIVFVCVCVRVWIQDVCFVTHIRHAMDVKVLLEWMAWKANCFDVRVCVWLENVATKIPIFSIP